MKRLSLAVLLALYGSCALADEPAVGKTNYQIAYESGDINTAGGSDSRAFGATGSVTFPLLGYLGGSLSGSYLHTSLAANYPNGANGTTLASAAPHASVNDGILEGTLFLRDPTIGRLGVGFGRERLRSSSDSTFIISGTDKLDSTLYAGEAEYYLSRVTLAASRTQTKFDAINKVDGDALAVSWYPTNIMRVKAMAEGMDFKNTYSLALEYQPEFLDNSAGVGISYSRQHQTLTNSTVMVEISYYFGNRVDLLRRDRYYR